eukprot:518045-Prorocentrum_minimum.AAC.1
MENCQSAVSLPVFMDALSTMNTGRDTADWQFSIVEHRNLVQAGYMSTDPKLRQEVYGDGDN